jgi:somatostatin receptor 2
LKKVLIVFFFLLKAFLSENFKKSFTKAFTCAAGKEVNAQLHVENSIFPKTTRGGSSKATTRKGKSDDNGDNGETQAFSNFVLQESNVEHHNDLEPSTAITMTSRSQFMGTGDKESLFKNGCSNQSTAVNSV